MIKIKPEPTEYFIRGYEYNYWITQMEQEKPINHIESEYEQKRNAALIKKGIKTINKNWYICCMRDDLRTISKFDFQNSFFGFVNGFESLNEALYILEFYINKEFDVLIWLGGMNRWSTYKK